jgi:hypothetical protein
MKFDTLWPVPSRSGASPADVVPTELPPRRLHAVTVLDAIATAAESEVLPLVEGERTMLPEERPYRTPAAFVANRLESVLQPLGYGSLSAPVTGVSGRGQAALVAWREAVATPALADVSMMIEGSLYRHLMSPMRGDVAVFADGTAGIVTKEQCSGCRHFEVAEVPDEGIPSVIRSTRWLTNVAFILRLVISAPTTAQAAPAAVEPKPKKAKPTEVPASA